MKIAALILCSLLLGGCLANNASKVTASSSRGRQTDDEQGRTAPRQMCEHTAIGGVPKSFCY